MVLITTAAKQQSEWQNRRRGRGWRYTINSSNENTGVSIPRRRVTDAVKLIFIEQEAFYREAVVSPKMHEKILWKILACRIWFFFLTILAFFE